MKHACECREVAYFMRRLYRQSLTTTSGGNISLRLDDDTVAITPSALDKARTRGAEIALMTMAGENLTPVLKPSIETQLHLAIYAARPDVKAIVHAHPPVATAFTASASPIDCGLVAESYVLLGQPVVAPYAIMGSPALAQTVADCARRADVILLANHGVLTVGDSLLRAFDRLELIEVAARMTVVVRQLGDVRPLSVAQRQELAPLRRQLGTRSNDHGC